MRYRDARIDRADDLVVPFPAAGAVDATTRIPGERLSARWGQPVIVDPGAAITITATLPNAIAARIGLPANSVRELIAYAKANPVKLSGAKVH